LFKKLREDDVLGRAAHLSFFFVLALFPLLLVVVTLLGYFETSRQLIQQYLLTYLARIAPQDAHDIVERAMGEDALGASGGLLSVGLLLALWLASSGVAAIQAGLNVAYGVRETRSWWHARVVAVLLTVALAVLTVAAFAVLVGGDVFSERVAEHFGWAAPALAAWRFLRWPLLMGFVLLGVLLIFRFASNRYAHSWTGILPGAFLAVGLCIAASVLLRLYFELFGQLSGVYGSLTAPVVLLTWLYAVGAALFVGAEFNVVTERRRGHGPSTRQQTPG
jgi:membrane protein